MLDKITSSYGEVIWEELKAKFPWIGVDRAANHIKFLVIPIFLKFYEYNENDHLGLSHLIMYLTHHSQLHTDGCQTMKVCI